MIKSRTTRTKYSESVTRAVIREFKNICSEI